MGFELIIAAKRDPFERARQAPLPIASPSPVATIDVNGAFCEQSASELARSIENVLHKLADTVVIRFEEIACEDPQSLVNFARWIEELRSNGHDVRVVSGEPHMDALLAGHTISPDAIIPPAEADAAAGRLVVDLDHK
jgi:hypothetical protein